MEEKGRVPEEAEASLESGPDRLVDVEYSVHGLLPVEEVSGTEDDDEDGGETNFDDIRDEDLGSKVSESDHRLTCSTVNTTHAYPSQVGIPFPLQALTKLGSAIRQIFTEHPWLVS